VTAHPVLLGILCFGLGMALQAILMLRGSFRTGDAKRAGLVVLFSLIGMIPGEHEEPYEPLWHVMLMFTVLGGAFAFAFRQRLLIHVGGRILLAWNIVLAYVVMQAGWSWQRVVSLLVVPTILTVINAFTDIDRAFGWRVFFYTWFSVILVVIAISGVNAGPLAMFFDRSRQPVLLPPLEMFLTGAAYLYIVTNAWFVLALWPFPLSRSQSWSDRMGEIRRHMSLLAQGYVWEKDDPWRSLAVLVGLPLILFAVWHWGSANRQGIVLLAIALMPLLAGPAPEVAEPPVTAPIRRKTRKGSRGPRPEELPPSRS
jgi:hypothetical protein